MQCGSLQLTIEKEKYPEIGRSNMFIGNYLRFFWLCEEREYERVTDEMLAYFSKMAQETGTLWEHDKPKSSCNHGFASSIGAILLNCLCGLKTIKNGKRKPVYRRHALE